MAEALRFPRLSDVDEWDALINRKHDPVKLH
jgi:hypothetical protein